MSTVVNRKAIYLGKRNLDVSEQTEDIASCGEVIVKVSCCGICGTDIHIYQGHMDNRVQVPHVMGHEFCGKIIAIAEQSIFKVGDRVAIEPVISCGQCEACRRGLSYICLNVRLLGVDTPGGFQQYVAVPVHCLHKLSESVSDRVAALVEPLAVAVHDVRRAGVQTGDHVVIIGGGPIGLLIALVVRYSGGHALVLEINPYRLKIARSLGFEAINPQEEDPVKAVEKAVGGVGVDVVFEVSGSKAGVAMVTEFVRPHGVISLIGIFDEPQAVDLRKIWLRELTLHGSRIYTRDDFSQAVKLAGDGCLPLESLISHEIPLSELGTTLEQLSSGTNSMKMIVRCDVSADTET